MNLHFVCCGNVLRSLVAETYVKSLNLNGVNVISSGTNVDWKNETEKGYFLNTLNLLDRHGIRSHAKDKPDQLTQQRADKNDVTVCMNQSVVDEALVIVELPNTILNWNIVDIGEGSRVNKENREQYEEEIYKEIIEKVDELVMHRSLH